MSNNKTIDNNITNDKKRNPTKNLTKHHAETARPAVSGIDRYLPDNAGQRNITNAQRAECVALAQSGASIPEIAMLLSLNSSQVERALKRASDAQASDRVAVSIQERKMVGGLDARLAEKSNKIITKLLDKLNKIVDEEGDMNKITTAIKVLYQISQDNNVKSEITTTVSRLRSM